jgi:ABC-type amino acid transport substrate-binding protein
VNTLRLLLFLGFLLCGGHSPLIAQSTNAPAQAEPLRRLKVAVFERPPYSFKDKDGLWKGLSIELWEHIAERLQIPYDYVETPVTEVYDKLNKGENDLALALAISGEMADKVEFTEPYLFSHGAVVTPRKSLVDSIADFYSHLWSREVMLILLSMTIGMLLFSLALVLVERKHKQGHFTGPSLQGVGSALWFSAVTMTTVGYGDKTPLSVAGRVITFFWMLVGVLLIALFTGTVASSITMEQIQHGIVRFDDLARFHVGCFAGSRSDMMLASRGIPAVRFPSAEEGLKSFSWHEINAFVGDSISLEYWMGHEFQGKFHLSIIPDAEMIYAFATRPHLPELSRINRVLLQITLAPDWRSKLERWTGPLSF